MKMYSMIAAAAFSLVATAAFADQVSMNFINTNDCGKAQNEVRLLAKPSAGIYVNAVCSEPGSYASDNGQTYEYRLYTTITANASLTHGTTIQLNDIDTNNCAYASEEVSLLSSASVSVQSSCSAPGAYASDNGQVYTYRVYSTMTIN